MSKSKVNMPEEKKRQCHTVIHTATAASAAAGALPIPMSDTIPITAAQIAMVVSLGKIFDFSISESVAKSIVGTGLVREAGRAIVTNILKWMPGAGSFFGGATAAVLTEASDGQ